MIKEITDKNVWENFFLQCQEKTFLNSWNWGEFQKKTEGKIWRLGVYDKQQLTAAALVVRIKAKRGTFLFLPHGPNIISNLKSQILKQNILELLINEKLKFLAKEEKASFIRIAPIWKRTKENIEIFKNLGFLQAPIHIHPELSWELDILKPENQLLKEMRKTTRYLIKKAEKDKNIEIIKSSDLNDLKEFSGLLNKTANRHHFIPFSLNYLKNQVSCFLSDNEIAIYLGKYKKEIISGAIVVYWQGTGFYHHGASLQKYNSNKVPVTYLQQWTAIKEARNQNCLKYNFWGIAEPMKKNHPWYGLSLFKMGFGGYEKKYVKTQDLPILKSYYLTRWFEKLRKMKRRL